MKVIYVNSRLKRLLTNRFAWVRYKRSRLINQNMNTIQPEKIQNYKVSVLFVSQWHRSRLLDESMACCMPNAGRKLFFSYKYWVCHALNNWFKNIFSSEHCCGLKSYDTKACTHTVVLFRLNDWWPTGNYPDNFGEDVSIQTHLRLWFVWPCFFFSINDGFDPDSTNGRMTYVVWPWGSHLDLVPHHIFVITLQRAVCTCAHEWMPRCRPADWEHAGLCLLWKKCACSEAPPARCDSRQSCESGTISLSP